MSTAADNLRLQARQKQIIPGHKKIWPGMQDSFA